jgi:hypothetical protein
MGDAYDDRSQTMVCANEEVLAPTAAPAWGHSQDSVLPLPGTPVRRGVGYEASINSTF